MSAQTLTNANAQDVLQTIINTEQGAVYADDLDQLTFYGRNWQANVGDINFTDAQERRGGGTAAFKCEVLWNSLVQILSDQPEPKPTSSKKKAKK